MTQFFICQVGLLTPPRAQQLALFGADATGKAVPLPKISGRCAIHRHSKPYGQEGGGIRKRSKR